MYLVMVVGAKCVSAVDLGPIYTKRQRQRCDDACDSVLIENNRVAPEWGCNLFSSDSFVFNENRIASVITALTLMLGVNGPLGFIYIRAKATSLLTCCIVSDLCIYTTATVAATNIKEKNRFLVRFRSNINELLQK